MTIAGTVALFASGFEHLVANMTVFTLALSSAHPSEISAAGAGWNLLWVTLGNILSGALVMGWGYWRIAGRARLGDRDAERAEPLEA